MGGLGSSTYQSIITHQQLSTELDSRPARLTFLPVPSKEIPSPTIVEVQLVRGGHKDTGDPNCRDAQRFSNLGLSPGNDMIARVWDYPKIVSQKNGLPRKSSKDRVIAGDTK
ncbi:hypothetical protein N7468_005391 [Penicillium chermesinum]|uniref:Uncharacterized protein n=1 Tax=Penicillium chermesinum TaxID=63820 RepID=A0A9W9TMX7_9EURO|nr:uncharacterized protein N7468_005391 [Penicillium chermesinum]KAJ5232435.1 hypothetical protein N7468_005391 [Penicillium chermesinum]KAJ6172094.1 hypothetical protein N7470_001161 [Penicillium chermesinum]